MAVPNLFDQMFTRPMESFMGESAPRGPKSRRISHASGTQIEQARSAFMALQAELQALDSKLRDARSIAPFDGVIVRKNIEVGDTMQPGQPLLTLADVEYLQVDIDIPSRLRPGLKRGRDDQRRTGCHPSSGCRFGSPRSSPWRMPSVTPSRSSWTCPRAWPSLACTSGSWCRTSPPASAVIPVIPASAIRYNGSLPGVYVLDDQGRP
jgi:hypothetical protein